MILKWETDRCYSWSCDPQILVQRCCTPMVSLDFYVLLLRWLTYFSQHCPPSQPVLPGLPRMLPGPPPALSFEEALPRSLQPQGPLYPVVSLAREAEPRQACVLVCDFSKQAAHPHIFRGMAGQDQGCLWPFRSPQVASLLFSLHLPSFKGTTQVKEGCDNSFLTTRVFK